MASRPRININSAHIIPAVALWQSWRIIQVACTAGLLGLGTILALNGLNFALDNSALRNERTRTRNIFFESCLSEWVLQNKPYLDGRRICNAAATQYVNSRP
jgi:hypothetical protein